MGEFKVGCSPLTGTIYAGEIREEGVWKEGKIDVTEDAVYAVAMKILTKDQTLEFTHKDKKYHLKIEEVQPTPEPEEFENMKK